MQRVASPYLGAADSRSTARAPAGSRTTIRCLSLARDQQSREASASGRRQQAFSLTRSPSRPARLRRGAVCMASWQEVMDPSSGKPYYWNTATNETRWQKPEDAEAPAAVASTSAPTPAAGSSGTGARKSNAQLLFEFFEYLLSPSAKFDYPSPSSAFIDLVEANREAIFDGTSNFYEFLNDEIDACDPETPMDTDWTAKAIFAMESGAAEAAAANARQSEAASSVAMWKPENMKWNSSVGILTRRQALESIRSRLSNPVLRDANPAF